MPTVKILGNTPWVPKREWDVAAEEITRLEREVKKIIADRDALLAIADKAELIVPALAGLSELRSLWKPTFRNDLIGFCRAVWAYQNIKPPQGGDALMKPVSGDEVAWYCGDTFIDFRDMAPADQWERIVEMLSGQGFSVVLTGENKGDYEPPQGGERFLDGFSGYQPPTGGEGGNG